MAQGVKQKKLTLILVLSVIFLLLLLATQLLKPTDKPVFSSLDRHSIESIRFDSVGRKTVLLEKKDNSWYLTSPLNRKADATRINVILAILSLPKNTIYAKSELNLGSLGLQPPNATLTLNEQIFYFGDKDPDSSRRYLQHNDKIALVSDIVFPLINKGVEAVAQMQLAPAGLIAIESNRYKLKKERKQWLSDEMSNANAEAVVAAWLKQEAKEILPWPLANIEKLNPLDKLEVTFRLTHGNTTMLDIFSLPELAVIHPHDADYALIITDKQFSSLQLK